MLRKAKKVVKVCLHSSWAVQISFQFDEFFWQKKFKILISRRFEIFTKTSHLKLVGIRCMRGSLIRIWSKIFFFLKLYKSSWNCHLIWYFWWTMAWYAKLINNCSRSSESSILIYLEMVCSRGAEDFLAFEMCTKCHFSLLNAKAILLLAISMIFHFDRFHGSGAVSIENLGNSAESNS